MLESLIGQLRNGQSLSPEQVGEAVGVLVGDDVPVETKAGFLTALAEKGESREEIAAFAGCLRDMSVTPPIDDELRKGEILDVCGTGGDKLGTFNISTTVGILVAAADVIVAKHGNRAITSKSGSADVLAELGVPVELDPADAAARLRDQGFAFFFAPKYHPAFRNIMPARRLCAERGQRTIFNFLGPLLNPARPTCQIIGVPVPALCEPLAHTLKSLGIRRGMVVSGRVGDAQMDELSTLGENTIAEFYQDRGFSVTTNSPSDFPLHPVTLDDLKGGDAVENAATVRAVLAGEDRGPKRDAVLLNAAAALMVAGRSRSMVEGWELAGETIDSGRAKAKLEQLGGGR